MLAIQPLGLGGAQEELRPVGVGAGIGHGEHAWVDEINPEGKLNKSK